MAVNIFELFGTISVKNSDANKAIDNTVSAAKNAGQKLVDIGDAMGKLGSGMTKAITVPIAGAITASIKSFADLEQAIGGIETMFEDSAGKVISNSETAYKRAGVSGTQYMEQVTSFSATLLQGLGGDTEKAAQAADTAMVDMSDNANKFGTNIGDIQNAYQGFAKDNYTMLDNLKLGYGGTAGEMARLVNESGVLGDSFEATAESVKDIPFHTLIEAIHVTQEEMGVTGTTALEAEETVSGAFGMMLASIQDLAAGFGQEGADMETLLANVASSVEVFADNIVRVLGNMWDNIPLPDWAKWAGALITAAGPILIVLAKIIGAVGKVGIAFQGAGSFMGGMAALFPNVASGLGLLKAGFAALTGPIGLAIAAVAAVVGVLIYLYKTNETVRSAIQTAWQFIKDIIATASQAVETVIRNIWGRIQGWLGENQELIKQTIDTVWSLISGIIDAALTVILPLVKGVWETIATITQVTWELITSYIQIALDLILGIITVVMQLIQGDWAGAWETIKNVASEIWGVIVATAKSVFSILQEYFVKLWAAISGLFTTAWGYISEFLSGIWNGILGIAQTIWGAIRDFFMVTIPQIVNGIIEWFQQLPERISAFFTRIIEAAIEWVSNMTQRATEIGTQFVDRVVQFIQELPYKIGFFLGEVIGATIQWVIDMGNKAQEAGRTFLTNVETFFTELPGRVEAFLKDTYNRATTWASNMWTKAQETGRNFLDRITNWFRQLPGRIGAFLTDAYNRATTWASNLWNKATEAGSRFVTNIINWFQRLPGRVQEWFSRTIKGASDFVRNMGSKASDAGQEFGNKIKSSLSALPGQMREIGANIISGLWGGLKNAWGNMTDWFGGLVSGFVDGVKSRLDINSPSGVFEHQVGEEIPAGMAKGIGNNQTLVDRAMDKMLEVGQAAIEPLIEPQISRDGINSLTGGSAAQQAQHQNGLQLLLTEIRNILGQINNKEETIIVEIDGQRYEVSEDGESVRKISNSLYNMQRTHDRSKGGR